LLVRPLHPDFFENQQKSRTLASRLDKVRSVLMIERMS
jgi:hypothetical protein